MRKEHAYFDRKKNTLIITGKKKDDMWYCVAKYKSFKGKVHQHEIWFRNGDTDYSPEWMLDGADCYELNSMYERDHWYEGFCYSPRMWPEHQHSFFAYAEGTGVHRKIIMNSIEVKERL